MPAIRDYSQAYHATTTLKHVTAPLPAYSSGDLLLAIITTDDSAPSAAQTVTGGMPLTNVFYNDDTGGTPAWTDYTSQANSPDTADWFPMPTVPTANDTINFGSAQKFSSVKVLASTQGVGASGPTIVVEYYNGSWVTLTTTTNTITDWRFATTVHAEYVFAVPADWTTVAVNGVTQYWIRSRCTVTGTYTTRPVLSQAWILPVPDGNNCWRQLYAYYAGTTPAPQSAIWKIAGSAEVDTTFFYSTVETANVELIAIKDVQISVDSGSAALTVNANSSGTYKRTTGSWATDGFAVGMQIMPTGNATAANNRARQISTITTVTNPNDTITVTNATGMVTESGNGDERMLAWPFNSNVSGGGAGSTFDGYTNSNANSSRTTLPTLTTTKDDCLLIWAANPDGANVPGILEGACQLIAGKDGTAHSDSEAWGYQYTAGVTPTVTFSAMTALVTEMAVIAINPPHGGATVRPAYGTADSSVYIDPFAGAAFQSNSIPAATITTPFTGNINGRPLVNGTFTALADTGINSYHGTTQLTGVTTAGSYAGLRMTIASRDFTNKNILMHIQPLTPVEIQTTDSVSLTGACGVGIGFASSAGNFKVWHVGGSAVTADFGRHQPVIINTGATTGLLQTTGSLVTTAVVDIGFMISGKIVSPDWLVAVVWVLDTFTIAGGMAATPMDIPQIVKCYADGHERRSAIQQGSKQALILGPVQIGNGGTDIVYLSLDGTAIEFPRQYNKTAKEVYYNSTDNVCGLKYYGGASDTIIHKNSVISSPSRYFWGLHASHSTSCTPDFSGLSVIGAGTITLNKAITITSLTINDYSTIDASSLTLNSSTIKTVPAGNDTITTNSTTAFNTCAITTTGVTAGNRLLSTATPNKFTSCTFTGSSTTGHAMRLTATGTFALVGNTFTSYGPTVFGFHTTNDVTSASDIVTKAAHGYTTGDPVRYMKQGGSAAIGLTDDTTYYVRAVSSSTIAFYTTSANAIADTSRIDLTASGTDTHYINSLGAAIFNDSGGAVTINISSGGGTTTIRNGSGASTTVNNAVTVKVTAKDANTLSAIESARVLLEAAAGGNLPAAASVTITRSGSTASVAHTAHGMSTGMFVIIRGANEDAYNGIYTIANVTTNAYDYTVSGTPATPATGTITATCAILSGVTDASGILQTTSFNYTSSQPITGKVRRATSGTKYKTGAITGTITTAGLDTTVLLIADE